jgi:hypothetical protein
VVSANPRLRAADRDLNGDGKKEIVVADSKLCTDSGNCRWNVFARVEGSRCPRYLGTIEAGHLEIGEPGSEGFHTVLGWWRFGSGGRYLLQHYEYQRGAYRVVEAMLCREQEDDRLLCATEERSPARDLPGI